MTILTPQTQLTCFRVVDMHNGRFALEAAMQLSGPWVWLESYASAEAANTAMDLELAQVRFERRRPAPTVVREEEA